MADRLGSHWPRRLRPLIGATDDGNWCDHLRSMRYPVRELVLVRFPRLPVRALSDPNPRASGGIRLFMEPVLRHLLRLHHCLLPPQIRHAGRIRFDRRRYDRGVHHCGFLRPGGNKKAARIHRELIARGHSDAQEKRPGKPEALHNQSHLETTYAACFCSTALPLPIGMTRGFFASGISRTKSTCKSPCSSFAPFTRTKSA